MRVVIFNEMPFPIHVTVVRISGSSLRFVFSKQQVPIPAGTVVGKADVGTGEGVETSELPDGMSYTCVQLGLADTVDIIYQEGTDQHDREVTCFRVRPQRAGLN